MVGEKQAVTEILVDEINQADGYRVKKYGECPMCGECRQPDQSAGDDFEVAGCPDCRIDWQLHDEYVVRHVHILTDWDVKFYREHY